MLISSTMLLLALSVVNALQPGLPSSVHSRRPTLAIAMRIRTPRRKGVSSRAAKANGLSIQGGYGRAAPKSGAGKQALAEETGTGKLGHVQVLLLKECALGSAGAVMPMSLAEFRNVVERKGVGRLARQLEIELAAASPEGVVEYFASAATAAPATTTAAAPATATAAAPADAAASAREFELEATALAIRAAVQVYDGTFSSDAIDAFGSGVYSRADGAVTAQQRAIEGILTALGDGVDTRTQAVEYWSKDTWQTMEARRRVAIS